mmetsp:Transcript_9631/g.18908  ORF Transcript_9631/g.18908 Transcript_9631/m.18908 type:complete len:202 (-) Transcript_9631:209-814(-)
MTPTTLPPIPLMGRQRMELVLYPDARSTSWLKRSSLYASGMLMPVPVFATEHAMPGLSKSMRRLISPCCDQIAFAFSSTRKIVHRSASTIEGALAVMVKSRLLTPMSGCCRLRTRSVTLRSLVCTRVCCRNSFAFRNAMPACAVRMLQISSSLSSKGPSTLLMICSTPTMSPAVSLMAAQSMLLVLYPVFLSKLGSNLESE